MNAPTEPYRVSGGRGLRGAGGAEISGLSFRYAEQLPVRFREFDLSVAPRVPLGPSVEHIYVARHLYLTDVEGDVLQLSGTIRWWEYTQESWPALRATQNRFPGLYWS